MRVFIRTGRSANAANAPRASMSGPGSRSSTPAKLPEAIRITKWERTGRYGLNLHFSDGHGTGIYTFRVLRAGCPCPECVSDPQEGTQAR